MSLAVFSSWMVWWGERRAWEAVGGLLLKRLEPLQNKNGESDSI
jgi:hypothetical protein